MARTGRASGWTFGGPDFRHFVDDADDRVVIAKRVALAGCDLYTSCEPCALCVAAMRIVGIRKLFYAASLEQSGAAFDGLPASARHPIDVEDLRAEAGAPLHARRLPAEQHMSDEAIEILAAWSAPRRAAGQADEGMHRRPTAEDPRRA